MISHEQLEVLLKGREAWNEWKSKNHSFTLSFPRFDFSNRNFSGYDLAWISFQGANFENADLADADLGVCSLNSANFRGANLRNASLVDASLAGADLSGVNLQYTELSKANFRRTNLTKANLEGATLYETYFIDVDLSQVVGLSYCRFAGPCTVDHRTLARSGTLPKEFLQGCGLPNEFISSLPKLLTQTTQFYSCFISFTEVDDELAQSLHQDLQDLGVRCWRWKEDAKWGRSFMNQIDKQLNFTTN